MISNKGLALLLLIIILPTYAGSLEIRQYSLGNKTYQLEVAENYQQRLQGLMFRKTLAANQGMLFIFPKLATHNIWMKNTLIPLTVIWLDEQFSVIGIQQLKPCRQSPCPVYGIPQKSKYIVELAESESMINVGDQLKLDF